MLRNLPPRRRAEVMTAIWSLLDDPYPDGVSKVALLPPFRYGTIALGAGGHLVTYSIENAEIIWIQGIEPQPGASP